jgi:16S rRNA (cytosine967-C5)-methyltransferase
MTTTNPRALCRDILAHWNPDTGFAANLIERAARDHNLDVRDRAFLNSLALGVLRNLTLLDHWIDHLRGRGQLKQGLRWLLRQGVCEVLLMRTPDHAAVSQTVKLAKKYEKGIVNAVLRRAVAESEPLLAAVGYLPLAVRFSLPAHLITRWEKRLGTDAAVALCEWMNAPAPVTFRANTLLPGAAESLKTTFGARGVEDQPGFFMADEMPFDAISAGLCYVQDPSTAAAPELLAPQPGECVLDACAAPGGKAGILAALMQNDGQLICTDSQQERIDMTADNLQRLGVTCAQTICHDWLADSGLPAQIVGETFDRILADVPCSNTGVMRRRVDVRWRLTSPKVFTALQEIQLAIVERLIPLLKPGGTLVYSTCSIEPEENEQMAAQILARHPHLELRRDTLLLPHINDTDGAYAAAFVNGLSVPTKQISG